MALTLYTNPMSRGRIARWMVEETGADHETVILGYADSMKSAEYRAINPMAKVPAIVHDGRVVTECAAICAYLAEAFPDAGLAPRDLDERAAYLRWLFFAAGPIEAAVTDKALGVTFPPERARMVGYGSFDEAIDALEGAVAANPWIAGARFTAADVYVGSQVIWGTQFGSFPKRDVFAGYIERLTAREAYKRAAAKDDAAMPKQPG